MLPRKAEWLVTYPTRLFEKPEFLFNKYSYRQLRKGFWSLPNDWELSSAIWSRDLRWKLRKACIRSMVPLFDKFFSRKPLGNTCHMWWDLLRYFGKDRDGRVVNEMFLALDQILLMDSFQCQLAALHGLGHLTHARKKGAINRYLKTHPDLQPHIREYAFAAIKGRVL
ncbi:MAG TPA: hypothetical protein VKN18_17420 [Blastocatellia bacterium]|nr:hypothetical protein [Blastocatellia bacterium]